MAKEDLVAESSAICNVTQYTAAVAAPTCLAVLLKRFLENKCARSGYFYLEFVACFIVILLVLCKTATMFSVRTTVLLIIQSLLALLPFLT